MLGAEEVIFPGKVTELVIQHQNVSPEIIHIGNIIQYEQIIFMNVCMCLQFSIYYTCIMTIPFKNENQMSMEHE